MRVQDTAFFRNKQEILFDFNAEEVSSDGSVLLLEKLERQHRLIKYFSNHIQDSRHSGYVKHDVEKLLKQRVFLLMGGYEDCNDVYHLKNDPLYKDILQGELASQPTLSRFENGFGNQQLSLFNGFYSQTNNRKNPSSLS